MRLPHRSITNGFAGKNERRSKNKLLVAVPFALLASAYATSLYLMHSATTSVNIASPSAVVDVHAAAAAAAVAAPAKRVVASAADPSTAKRGSPEAASSATRADVVQNNNTIQYVQNNNIYRDIEYIRFAWRYPNETDGSSPVETNHVDSFSATWWLDKKTFLKVDSFEKISGSPEGATFDVFSRNPSKVRMTRDWLDLGVEHMSKWWKLILETNINDARVETGERVIDIFKRYVYSPDRDAMLDKLISREYVLEEEDPMQVTASTIAVIAYMPDKLSDARTVWTLAATLMSLLQVGIGRIIVSGHEQKEEVLVRKAFAVVTDRISNWPSVGGSRRNGRGDKMSRLNFCVSADATTPTWSRQHRGGYLNIPYAALKKLRHVFINNETDPGTVECWLGGSGWADKDRWRYVFLGEPDTLLVTKPDALPGLASTLRGGDILAPHRYQPLPHFSDFTKRMRNEANFLPNEPPFRDVVEIDAFSTPGASSSSTRYNSCCDLGKYKPYLLHEKCEGTVWWQCGFQMLRKPERLPPIIFGEGGRELTPAIVAHKRLLGYTLMRLTRGTGVVFASAAWGKTCRPHYGPCTSE